MSGRFTTAEFEEHLGEHKIMGTRCQDCGSLHLPPRALCPDCHGVDLTWEELDGRGKVTAFTAVHIAPTAMIAAGYGRSNPYLVGIVELRSGPSISAQIVGADPTHPEELPIGAPVEAVFLTRGEGADTQTSLAFRTMAE